MLQLRPIFDFLLGSILIAVLDSLGAMLSNKLNFKYILLLPVSLAIYVFIGFLLGKTNNYPTTCLYAGLLGLFDGTIGLKLSIYFKANMGISKERVDKLESVGTSIYMIIVGLLFGSLGYVIAAFT
jgi:hypothetical protein